MKKNISEIIKKFIIKNFSTKNEIDNNYNLLQELFIDSADIMRILIFIEEEFKIDIGRNDMIEENFENINALSNFVVSKISKS